jgi:hypothetical protein
MNAGTRSMHSKLHVFSQFIIQTAKKVSLSFNRSSKAGLDEGNLTIANSRAVQVHADDKHAGGCNGIFLMYTGAYRIATDRPENF